MAPGDEAFDVGVLAPHAMVSNRFIAAVSPALDLQGSRHGARMDLRNPRPCTRPVMVR